VPPTCEREDRAEIVGRDHRRHTEPHVMGKSATLHFEGTLLPEPEGRAEGLAHAA